MTLREIDALIAEKVTQVVCLCDKDAFGWSIHGYGTSDGRCHKCGLFNPDCWPTYSTKPAASKLVREKLAERYCTDDDEHYHYYLILQINGPQQFEFSVNDDEGFRKYFADAKTEELAVALCALKTVGIDAEVTE